MKKLAFQRVLLTSGIFFASAFTLSCGSPDDVNEEQSTTESVQMESASNLRSELQPLDTVSALGLSLTEAQATEWRLTGNGGSLSSGNVVSLFNTYASKFVKYDDRLGVNLNWASSVSGNIQLLRQAGAGEIKYGENVAIGVRDGSKWEYLVYGSQTVGINLTSRTNVPQYNWQMQGGAIGSAVKSGDTVRLLNLTNNHHVVYCKRPTGVNLAWRNNCYNLPIAGRTYKP